MQHSPKPEEALQQAAKLVQAMRAAESLDDLEQHWIDFLHRLERAWSKATAHYSRSPKWTGWQSNTAKLRKHDPLLRYCLHARNADEHRLEAVVERDGGYININPAAGFSLHIKSMEIRNGKVIIDSPQDLKIDFAPAKIRLLPVIDRGVTYAVPTTHLGAAIDSNSVVEIAGLATDFYRRTLAEAQAFFIT